MPGTSRARASVRASGRTSKPEQGREVDLRKELIDKARSYLDIAETASRDAEPMNALRAMMRAAQCMEVIGFLDTGKWDDSEEEVLESVGLAELEEKLDDLDAESED